MNSRVNDWFGEKFGELHPKLQQLHQKGGVLRGNVKVEYGRGLGGLIGRRMAFKLGVPDAGTHPLSVNIFHDENGLHWDRAFGEGKYMRSLFQPLGDMNCGYWIEKTGALKLKLTVKIVEGGWYWHCIDVRFFGIPIPLWMVPKANAFKTIEEGAYRFHVGFSVAMIGKLFSYSGNLSMVIDK